MKSAEAPCFRSRERWAAEGAKDDIGYTGWCWNEKAKNDAYEYPPTNTSTHDASITSTLEHARHRAEQCIHADSKVYEVFGNHKDLLNDPVQYSG